MKKKLTSLLAGLTTAALALSLCTTALAAPAGKKDETGKTASQVSKTVPGRTWQREYLEGYLYYTGPAPAKVPEEEKVPAFRPTWIPEGYVLDDVHVNGVPGLPEDTLAVCWSYSNGSQLLSFVCYLRPCGNLGSSVGASVSGDSVLYKTEVQGHDADFYQGDDWFGNDLIWENERGNLFHLFGHLERAVLEKIAGSVKEIKLAPVPEYELTALPSGAKQIHRSLLPEYADTFWSLDHPCTLTFTYSTLPLSAGGNGTEETVKVNGREAQFWQGEKKTYTSTRHEKGGTTVTTSVEACFNTLLWTDPETKINFCLKGHLDKEVLIFLAEHMALKAPETAETTETAKAQK